MILELIFSSGRVKFIGAINVGGIQKSVPDGKVYFRDWWLHVVFATSLHYYFSLFSFCDNTDLVLLNRHSRKNINLTFNYDELNFYSIQKLR